VAIFLDRGSIGIVLSRIRATMARFHRFDSVANLIERAIPLNTPARKKYLKKKINFASYR
jgi:hypothetical protein